MVFWKGLKHWLNLGDITEIIQVENDQNSENILGI